MSIFKTAAIGLSLLIGAGAIAKYTNAGQGIKDLLGGLSEGTNQILSPQIKPVFAPAIGITGLKGEDPLCGTRAAIAEVLKIPQIACQPSSTYQPPPNDRTAGRPAPPYKPPTETPPNLHPVNPDPYTSKAVQFEPMTIRSSARIPPLPAGYPKGQYYYDPCQETWAALPYGQTASSMGYCDGGQVASR